VWTIWYFDLVPNRLVLLHRNAYYLCVPDIGILGLCACLYVSVIDSKRNISVLKNALFFVCPAWAFLFLPVNQSEPKFATCEIFGHCCERAVVWVWVLLPGVIIAATKIKKTKAKLLPSGFCFYLRLKYLRASPTAPFGIGYSSSNSESVSRGIQRMWYIFDTAMV